MPDDAQLDPKFWTDEDIESREFLLALANGNARMAELIDLRFRTQDRRAQKRHWETVQRLDTVEIILLDLQTIMDWFRVTFRWTRRLAVVLAGAAGLAGSAGGILRLLGVL
jgi:hypothetical protein